LVEKRSASPLFDFGLLLNRRILLANNCWLFNVYRILDDTYTS
jgi:hypothetical protein